jgi:hypothetical protein
MDPLPLSTDHGAKIRTSCRCGFPLTASRHVSGNGVAYALLFAGRAMGRMAAGDRVYACPSCAQDFRGLAWQDFQAQISRSYP